MSKAGQPGEQQGWKVIRRRPGRRPTWGPYARGRVRRSLSLQPNRGLARDGGEPRQAADLARFRPNLLPLSLHASPASLLRL
jgi:hypothetical protein